APAATLLSPHSPRIRTDGTGSFPVLPKDLRKIAPGDFTLATVPRRLGGAAVRLWTEAAGGGQQGPPASLPAGEAPGRVAGGNASSQPGDSDLENRTRP